MADLPRLPEPQIFRPVGAKSEFASTQAFTAIGDKIQKSGESQLTDIAVQNAVTMGAKAGTDIDFEPIPAVGAAAKAFDKAGMEANKYAATADMYNHLNDIKKDVEKNLNGVDSLDEFHKRVQAYGQGLLDTVPDQNKAYVEKLLSYHGNVAYNDLASKVEAQTRQQNFGIFTNDLGSYSNMMQNSAYRQDVDKKGNSVGLQLFGQVNGLINNAEKGNLISPVQAEKLRQQQAVTFNQANILGQFHAIPSKNIEAQEKALNDFQRTNQFDKVLNLDQKQVIASKMQRSIDENKSRNGLNNASLIKQARTYASVSQETGQEFPATFLSQVALNGDEDVEKEVQELQKNSQTVYSAKTNLQYASPEQRANIISSFAPSDINDPNLDDKVRNFNAISQINRQQLSQIKSDPAAYFGQSQAVKESFQEFNQSGKGDPYGTLLHAQIQGGVPSSQAKILSSQQATQWQNAILSQSTPEGQYKQLQELGKTYGQYTPMVIKQLNLPSGLKAVANMSPSGLQDLPVILPALQTPQGKLRSEYKKESGVTNTSDVDTQVNSALSDYLEALRNGPSLQTFSDIEDIKNNTTNAALAYLIPSTGGNYAEDSASSSAIRAANALYLDKLNFAKVNGHNYFFPKNLGSNPVAGGGGVGQPINPDTVTSAVSIFTANAQNFNFAVPTGYRPELNDNPQLRRRMYKQETLTNAYVHTLPDNTGVQLMDSNGRTVKDMNGKNIQFTWDDLLNNQNSDISKLISSNLAQNIKDQKELFDFFNLPNNLNLLPNTGLQF